MSIYFRASPVALQLHVPCRLSAHHGAPCKLDPQMLQVFAENIS